MCLAVSSSNICFAYSWLNVVSKEYCNRVKIIVGQVETSLSLGSITSPVLTSTSIEVTARAKLVRTDR